MPDAIDVWKWPETVRQRYENYLKTSFFFKDPELRESFREALGEGETLLKGPFPEPARSFKTGRSAFDLAGNCFRGKDEGLVPALTLKDRPLYAHQDKAVHATHIEKKNIVVATGTASGKTESFLYPILFELYRQHLAGEIEKPGVRAMILYPMNALANDQRERLGEICRALEDARSGFKPTFGQYIGQTPYNKSDKRRNGYAKLEEKLLGEMVFRDDMRETPPHILLTNYSMLEYLLIRPQDSLLFDKGRGKHWQFIVLDEAHQYRGAKGMEMGMLIRRLKQRLREGGREGPFRCIATSATISAGEGEEDRKTVAAFAEQLFDEKFSESGIIFGESQEDADNDQPQRVHAFLRALEGAFLVHQDGKDRVFLNRKSGTSEGPSAKPLEIALCRECGQHYYVGREENGELMEAVRDPSNNNFGVEYYFPTEDGDKLLCRSCGTLSASPECDCGASVHVKKCEAHKDHADQLKKCEACGYQRGGIGDPVQEIVHGSDGPNAVIATALHELLPDDRRRILAFADSRQEAAFFAWYAENSYEKLRDRNLIIRAIKAGAVNPEGLSVGDLRNRTLKQWESAGLFKKSDTQEDRSRQVLTSILREALTDERRLSLAGVGLVRWFVQIPDGLALPENMYEPPWNFSEDEARGLVGYLLDELRRRRAMNLPEGTDTPSWGDVSSFPQQGCSRTKRRTRPKIFQWCGPQSAVASHFFRRLLSDTELSEDQKKSEVSELAEKIWKALRGSGEDPVLSRGSSDGTFRLNPSWLRVRPTEPGDVWKCGTCATLSAHNIRGICPRNRCPGHLSQADPEFLEENHYRILYENPDLPPALCAEEHTAQIDSDEARKKQDKFKDGGIHLLSSSTTFEVGVDLGDLEAVFLRNVPPEPFNYAQRVGRAGRRETTGFALTYCRRNPHDLYHYEKPVDRLLEGKIRPPRLRMTNEKIILRHMAAAALSAFFRKNAERFENVTEFVGNWEKPSSASDLREFCRSNDMLKESLNLIVPKEMHSRVGLKNDAWIDKIAGRKSRFVDVQKEVCTDYKNMNKVKDQFIREQPRNWTSKVKHLERRIKTIAEETALNFLSRKAVIPKYGFPVDVVELETGSAEKGVVLQRNLSQAIAEYAPGGKVVANKKEWESCGVKLVADKAWPVRHYDYGDTQSFKQWDENDPDKPTDTKKKYLIPEFGFVTPFDGKPKEPLRRARRLYTTRPFFRGFEREDNLETKTIQDVQVTKALPGILVVLCEGRNGDGFRICRSCGRHVTDLRTQEHKTPWDSECVGGRVEKFSLGHELVTDVVRLQFPELADEWSTYSVAYAVLLGSAEVLGVPPADLNVTIARGGTTDECAVVLYDNVPGGAGLVAQIEEQESVFSEMLCRARERVSGDCGCDSSCYGCLRSYRNQFAHPHLNRKNALKFLSVNHENGT